jgi:hypothetical protein
MEPSSINRTREMIHMTESKLDNFGPGFVPGKVTTSSDRAVTRALERDHQIPYNEQFVKETRQESADES